MGAGRFEAQDADFARRVRDSFGRQTAMATMGASMVVAEPGRVVIELDWAPHLTQQHGFLHGGIVSSVLDSACGYAGSTLMPADAGVLSIEFKVNFVAPAQGRRFRAEGVVVKPGRTLTFTEGRAWALGDDGGDKLIATMQATLMAITGRENIKH